MDIEKLIKRLRTESLYADKASLEIMDLCMEAATSLTTLQAENEKMRAELEQIPSCIYYKQGGLCRYGGDDPANVCVLGPCDHDVSVQDVLTELEQVKTERDAIEQDFRDFTKQWWEENSGFPCRWCKFENAGSCEWKVKCQSEEKICAGRAFEWRGKKEG